jgi:hypothetical protein
VQLENTIKELADDKAVDLSQKDEHIKHLTDSVNIAETRIQDLLLLIDNFNREKQNLSEFLGELIFNSRYQMQFY